MIKFIYTPKQIIAAILMLLGTVDLIVALIYQYPILAIAGFISLLFGLYLFYWSKPTKIPTREDIINSKHIVDEADAIFCDKGILHYAKVHNEELLRKQKENNEGVLLSFEDALKLYTADTTEANLRTPDREKTFNDEYNT